MSNSLCELIYRHKGGPNNCSKMRTSKLDRNHAVFIERTREGDQLYSILATKSSSESDSRPVLSHRKQKRRRGSMISIWRNIFLTGTFFFLLVLMTAMSWLVISMKFKLESLEVKVIRLGNDVDSLLRTQLTWPSTQNTITSISDQIKEIKEELSRVQLLSRDSEQVDIGQLSEVQHSLQKLVTDLQVQLAALNQGRDAKSVWALLSGDSEVLCQIRDNCQTKVADGS